MKEITEFPEGEAPVQFLPETSSDERMHVLDATCWCKPDHSHIESADNVKQPALTHHANSPEIEAPA